MDEFCTGSGGSGVLQQAKQATRPTATQVPGSAGSRPKSTTVSRQRVSAIQETGGLVIVVLDHSDDDGHDTWLLPGHHEAAALVEELLEAGFDETAIRVFAARLVEMHVTQRPCVTLLPQEKPSDEQPEPEAKVRQEEAPFTRGGSRFSSQFRPS